MSNSPAKRIIACQACHRKKVKCSGTGPPCTSCAESSIECSYPTRDRTTKVGQRYLEKILDENKRLSNLLSVLQTPPLTPAPGPVIGDSTPRADNADRNPLVEEHAWFVPVNAVDLPVHIGEAADAAFATRFRQALSKQPVSHFPRLDYLGDDVLRGLAQTPAIWPSHSRLRFLVDVALKAIKRWHIVRPSEVIASVEKLLQNEESCDWLTQCKTWALLALGDVFSSRCALPDSPFPGAKYWSMAMNLIQIAPERPRLEASYASCLNRRHTAITLASAAVRLCVILGLHLDISDTQLKDPVLREHRCRLWWTAYRYDRFWASKIGWPPSIPDESVEIGFPSDSHLTPASRSDFGDADYLICTIKLAGMLNHAINTLYVRKRQAIPFSERVQAVVRALREWADGLPQHLKLSPDADTAAVGDHLLYMHLAFNQAVIVITRPVLLHLLRQHRSQASNHATQQIQLSDSALSLTTACVRCARQSMELLKRSWADGTFSTFDYFSTQFIFSAATILALSALLGGSGSDKDREDFLLARSFLHQLVRNGNFGAKEFTTHLDAVHISVQQNLGAGQSSTRPDVGGTTLVAVSGTDASFAGQPFIPGPPTQDFLNNPEIDLDLTDIGGNWIDWQDVFLPDMP